MKKKINIDDPKAWQELDWDDPVIPELLKRTDQTVNVARANRIKALDPKFRKKISEVHKGKIETEETRQKKSKSHIGKKFSAKHKANMSKSQAGKIVSDETRKKQSITRKGVPKSEEFKKQVSLTTRGRPQSAEHTRKISEATKGRQMPKQECPYCNKICDIGNYSKWHGDKCKHKGNQ